jgi:hypothetical protein
MDGSLPYRQAVHTGWLRLTKGEGAIRTREPHGEPAVGSLKNCGNLGHYLIQDCGGQRVDLPAIPRIEIEHAGLITPDDAGCVCGGAKPGHGAAA